MNKILKFLVSTVILVIICCCFTNIWVTLYNYNKDKEVVKKIQVVKEETMEKENAKLDKELYSINDDYRFWIKIDNTKIDYPVVQYTDNEYYLKHDFLKNKNQAGAVFLDYEVNDKSRKSVVYGHNMKDVSIFADLELFKDKEFFNENKFINIEKDNKEYIYEVFSVYYLSGENIDYLQCNFNSDEEFFNFINEMKDRSLFDSDKELNFNNILTLSTCSYEGVNYRTAVHAQLIQVR